MRAFLLLVAAAAAVVAAEPRAAASIQGDMLCWEPDFELPVPCDGDDDDD